MDTAHEERMTAARLPGDTIVAVLYAQHARIRDQFDAVTATSGAERAAAFDTLRELIATHQAAEDVVLRTVTDKLLPAGLTRASTDEEESLARELAELERTDVQSAQFLPRLRLLDLAGGTGDISFLWLKRGGGPVLLTDINASMLSVGRDRAVERGMIGDVSLAVADAERLPLPDRSFDRVSIAFGLRNCTNKEAVLAEARRVLKPGGRFLCLEFSRVQVAALAPLYDAWSFKVLPRLGQMVAGDAESYQYLAESIRTFPDQDTLAGMMRDAGLEHVTVRNLSGGIAAIHAGWRL